MERLLRVSASPRPVGSWCTAANRIGYEHYPPRCRLLTWPIYKRGKVSDQTDVLQGTLALLIMRTIALEPMHGWAIAQRIQQISDDMLRVQQGSLYPALHRLEHQGWITADWGASENNRRARFYSLTKAGRKQLEVELSKWDRLSAGVNLVL